jgi:hypothetical protein
MDLTETRKKLQEMSAALAAIAKSFEEKPEESQDEKPPAVVMEFVYTKDDQDKPVGEEAIVQSPASTEKWVPEE